MNDDDRVLGGQSQCKQCSIPDEPFYVDDFVEEASYAITCMQRWYFSEYNYKVLE